MKDVKEKKLYLNIAGNAFGEHNVMVAKQGYNLTGFHDAKRIHFIERYTY